MAAAPPTVPGKAKAVVKDRHRRRVSPLVPLASQKGRGKRAGLASLRPKPNDGDRKCIVTGAMLPKDQLIRFVIGPGQAVVPDLAHSLPGRGLWVSADAGSLQIAMNKNLFAKAAKEQARVDADLLALVARLMHQRCLSFIGLAKSAGIAILGQPQVEQAIKANKIDMLLLADDAAQGYEGFVAWRNGDAQHTDAGGEPPPSSFPRKGGRAGAVQADSDGVNFQQQQQDLTGQGTSEPVAEIAQKPAKQKVLAVARRFSRQELGAALGHEQIVYAGLKPHALTEKCAFELARLEKIAPVAHTHSNIG